MAFTDIELLEFFEPIELYEFTRGSFSWYFTSADANIDFDGNTYVAVPISRSKILATQDIGKTTLKIKVSRTNTFALQYIVTSPTDVITLTITRIHDADPDPAVTFKGRVINVAFKEDGATITCQPNLSSLRRPGLRRLYQTACPHVLYGPQCGVIKDSFKTVAVLTGVNGLVLASPSLIVSFDPTFDPTWFVGGFIEFDNSGLIDKRFILEHNNILGTITVNLVLSDAIVGSTINVFPGCDHTTATCNDKFSVIENYGGFPFIPSKNPQNGTSVF